MQRLPLIGLALAVPLAAFVYINNTSLLSEPRGGRSTLVAHRGLHQTFPADGLKADTCTAARIHPPEHGFLENTISSMQAAFEAGADVVELDVHPTTDGHFAVFHDWTLDCRTDGNGVTRGRTLAELKALDIGHGYTADGGKTYPFRGKGAGLMPSLDEVLAAFPDRRLLIDIKSNDPADGENLANRLLRLPPGQLSRIMVYGGDRPVDTVRARIPHLKTMSRASVRRCLINYIGIGWTGYVPLSAGAACSSFPSTLHPGYGAGPIGFSCVWRLPGPKSSPPVHGMAGSRTASTMPRHSRGSRLATRPGSGLTASTASRR